MVNEHLLHLGKACFYLSWAYVLGTVFLAAVWLATLKVVADWARKQWRDFFAALRG